MFGPGRGVLCGGRDVEHWLVHSVYLPQRPRPLWDGGVPAPALPQSNQNAGFVLPSLSRWADRQITFRLYILFVFQNLLLDWRLNEFLYLVSSDDPVTPQTPSNDSMPGYCRNEEGDIFLAAESWKPNVCSSCVCLDGAISCFSESCPPVNCARPVLRKGQCCPYCLGMWPWTWLENSAYHTTGLLNTQLLLSTFLSSNSIFYFFAWESWLK